jgi:hypothetical protein
MLNNRLCAARGYKNGDGKVAEVKLSEIFEGVRTYQQLMEKYYAQEGLTIFDIAGNVCAATPAFTVLQLSSLWR